MERKLLPAPQKPKGLLPGRTLDQMIEEICKATVEFPKVPVPYRFGRSSMEDLLSDMRWMRLMMLYRRELFIRIDPV